jgi:large subunit ribosomal protein L1
MAKKQTNSAGEAADVTSPVPEKSAAAPAKESKKSSQAKPKAPKEKTAPTAPAVESPSPAPPVAPSAEPVASVAAPSESTKKRGKRPGRSPSRGKKLRALMLDNLQKTIKEGPLPLKKAIGQLKQMKRSKFDETVEVHMALGVDMTQNDQMVRGTVPLPHGIGKSVRVIVFCQGDNVAKAKEAGADFAGSDELVKKIQQENWLDFDVALATQDLMGMVSRLGKVLGPRGLMPTPKSGTVITTGGDVGAAVREFKAGKVEYRADKGGNIHAGVGKLSFDEDKLVANIVTFVEQVRAVKPSGVKGNYVKKIVLSATMSPGILITV